MDDILGIRRVDHDALYFKYARTKSAVWAYEREWRVWDLKPQPSEAGYYDQPLLYNEVEAIYLGCKIASEHKATITSLVNKKYPAAKLFQAQRRPERYALEFVAV